MSVLCTGKNAALLERGKKRRVFYPLRGKTKPQRKKKKDVVSPTEGQDRALLPFGKSKLVLRASSPIKRKNPSAEEDISTEGSCTKGVSYFKRREIPLSF